MTTKNAIKKLEKLGYKVEKASSRTYRATLRGGVLEFSQNGEDQDASIVCIGVRNHNDESDPMTDYCAFTFYNNLTQALKYNI